MKIIFGPRSPGRGLHEVYVWRKCLEVERSEMIYALHSQRCAHGFCREI